VDTQKDTPPAGQPLMTRICGEHHAENEISQGPPRSRGCGDRMKCKKRMKRWPEARKDQSRQQSETSISTKKLKV
uniref:Uncharacterized protein n=1 Tax=Piliocolobus tephrosceles TaxID=591936 RepID=A0A8C9HT70_9PRIM